MIKNYKIIKFFPIIIFILLLFSSYKLSAVNRNIIAVENFDCLNTHGKDQEYIFLFPQSISKYLWVNTDYQIMHRSLTKLHYLENELEKLSLLKSKKKRVKLLPANHIISGEYKTTADNISIRFKYVNVTLNSAEYSDWFDIEKNNISEKFISAFELFIKQKLDNFFSKSTDNRRICKLSGNIIAVNSILRYPDIEQNYAELLTEYLKISVAENSKFQLINRENIDLFTYEIKLKLSGLSDNSVELGKIINADNLVTALVDLDGLQTTELHIFFYNMTTAELTAVFTYKFDKKKFAEKMLRISDIFPDVNETEKQEESTFIYDNALLKNEAAIEFYNAMLVYNRSKNFKHPEEFKQALTAANNAILLDPEFVGSYFVRGRLLGLMHRKNEEIEQHKHTIEKFPGNPWAGSACYYIALYYYFNVKNYDKALELYQKTYCKEH